MTAPIRHGLLHNAYRIQLSLSGLKESVDRVERESITGLKLILPSDIPERIGEAHGLRAGIDDQTTWQDNANGAKALLDVADEALGQATELVKRAREIAVSMANDTWNADDRALAADEIDSLKEEMLRLANTRYGDRYLFAGTRTGAPAFDEAGVYQGSSEGTEVLVGQDLWVEDGWPGDTIFRGDADPLGALDQLATALRANQSSAISESLGSIDDAMQQVIASRGRVGNAFNAADRAATLAESLEETLSGRLQDIVEADPYEAYTQLASLRTAYDSALQVSAGSMKTRLLDFI